MADAPICYGEPLPPVPNKPFLKLAWARVGCPINGIFAADTWTGHWVHYRSYTVPCERSDRCPYCGKLPQQYQAYIPFWDVRKAEYWILQLPDGAARQLAGAIETYKTLNGVEFNCRRLGTKRNGPVEILVVGKRRNPSPDVIDMQYSLNRVWGMNLERMITEGLIFTGPPKVKTFADLYDGHPNADDTYTIKKKEYDS